ncbi:MAG: NFACT family protein, partial [Bacilli bacterium]
MAFDGFVTRAVVHELASHLVSGRIYKIYQPHQSDIVLTIRARGANYKLLLSANPSFPRLHLTQETFTNPVQAPMFCMLLRKHCEGAVIERITQVGMERIVHMDVRTRDELGDEVTRRLIVEVMGRHSNLILMDPTSNAVLDSVHHVTPAVSQHRIVLPGRPYVFPPNQDKENPLEIAKDTFISRLQPNNGKMDQQLVELLTGMSPLLAKELMHRNRLGSREELWEHYQSFIADMKNDKYYPNVTVVNSKTMFSVYPLTQFQSDDVQTFSSISECLESFFHQRADRDTVRQRVQDLSRFVRNEYKKNEKKIQKLKTTMSDAEGADQYRIIGDLLMSLLHTMKRGDHEVEIYNYYEEEAPVILVQLDPLLTPTANAQAYYKKYNKAKASLSFMTEQIDKTEIEMAYLDSILQQLESASISDIDDIREELVEEGYIRNRNKGKRKSKSTQPTVSSYWSRDGVEIVVGKN